MTWVDAKTVADVLDVPTGAVYRAAKAGSLPCLRIGTMLRFDLDEVRAAWADRAERDAVAKLRRMPRRRVEPQWRIRATNEHRYPGVYFIQPEAGGLIKIGWSGSDIGRRLEEHQEGSPLRLRIIGTIRDAGLGIEYDLHLRFRESRVHGEWFEPTPDLVAFIAAECQAEAVA